MIRRRDLLNSAMAAGAASLLVSDTGDVGGADSTPTKIIDTNASLFHWPFRRLPLDETSALLAKIRSLSIAQVWAGSFEALLHRDLTSVNQRLFDECQLHPELIPIGSINLELPGWESDLQRCFAQHRMPGIRLHPNYHGYTLDDSRFKDLLGRATLAGKFVQIAVAMEDTRTQHPMLPVADVDLSPLPKLVRNREGARVQLLNYRPRGPLFDALADTPQIRFDTARVEGTAGVAKLVERVSADRVMFGSHAPFLVPEAALIRVRESRLDGSAADSLAWKTAQRELGDSRELTPHPAPNHQRARG